MESLKNIVVCLDNTPMDQNLVRMAKVLADFGTTEKVIFMHVVKSSYFSKSLLNEFPTLMEDAIKERKIKLETKIEEVFNGESTKNISFEISEGEPAKNLFNYVKSNNINLIVAGKKNTSTKKATLLSQLVRKADCSVLVVPEDMTNFNFKKLLVPIDYSKGSRLALDLAAQIGGKELKNAEILTQNIFSVPTGYHYTGKSYKEFANIMKDNATADYKNFSGDISFENATVKNIYTLDKNEDLMQMVANTAQKKKVDAIIIGSKLRSASSTYFTGASAYSLLIHETQIPVLIVKEKGKSANILEYLMEL